ncbi:MAG: LCP family protein [Patescibacteria group bacterium]
MSKIILENKYKNQQKKSRKKLWIIVSVVAFVLLVGAGAGYAYWKGIFTKNYSGSSPFFKKLSGEEDIQLKGEGDGRINILLLGQGGAKHPGGNLTDSIEVISIDPENNTMAMLSIPRDLYVTVKSPSYAGKINAVYDLGNKQTKEGGGNLMKQTVGTILDLPIHYYVCIDFAGFKKAIDAVGGIDVLVEKDIYDPSFPADDMIHYQTFKIKAGNQHMDGDTALKFARSRETTSDFDRSARQQKVMQAFKDKVTSSGTWSNPEKILSLVSALGSSVKTDLATSEIKELVKILKKIEASKIVTKVLDNGASGLLISDSSSGVFYLKPKTGNWKQIQQMAHEIFSDPYLKKEAANIRIVNSSGVSDAGQNWADVLKKYGYNIVEVKTGESKQKKSSIYDYSNGDKKYTIQFLSSRLKAEITKKTKPSGSTIDLELTIGEDNKEAYVQTKG